MDEIVTNAQDPQLQCKRPWTGFYIIMPRFRKNMESKSDSSWNETKRCMYKLESTDLKTAQLEAETMFAKNRLHQFVSLRAVPEYVESVRNKIIARYPKKIKIFHYEKGKMRTETEIDAI